MVHWFCLMSEIVFDGWMSYVGKMGQCNTTFDLKINLGHSDLYFIVQWFLLFFALQNILVLLAKRHSGEVRCPAAALIIYIFPTLGYYRAQLTTKNITKCTFDIRVFRNWIAVTYFFLIFINLKNNTIQFAAASCKEQPFWRGPIWSSVHIVLSDQESETWSYLTMPDKMVYDILSVKNKIASAFI